MVLESLMQSGAGGGQSSQQMSSQQDMMSQEMQQPERAASDIALIGSAASVLLAWYEFYYRKNKTTGLFVGLWPPTILAFANYLRQRGMEDKLDKSVLIGPESGTILRRFLQ